MARRRRRPRSFYARHPLEVAPDLIGSVLVHGGRSGRIVEVEAYCGADDPGSHAFRGRTPRTTTMFGPAGHLYVYFSYGLHWCANVVCGAEGEAGAVLLRAVAPVTGIEAMRAARARARRERDLTAGPARLCQAFGVDGSFDGTDLVKAERGLTIVDDGAVAPPAAASTRVGLSSGEDLPWRWYVRGDPNVSGRPR
ncbi:DNA-3-methyladenine glycosylase [Iamia sp.]|uniref:DNA-3-methyladenine glycosylase n=1 Tax=Iamia sp. TaxID=2722710 RepID=UPI002BE1834F|nr:DNA-3-methyladenine glycosylase [Iamia sp.]HXH56495.1 DNA-3-methyladenine glycosylase [Iamia sp.]